MDRNREILKEYIDRAVYDALAENRNSRQDFDMLVESALNESLNLLLEKGNDTERRRRKVTNDIKKVADARAKNSKRQTVLSWLRSDAVNTAEIRRRLEGEPKSQEDEDNKRSYFMKKVNQSHGKRFSDDEINRLYSIKTSLGQ